MASPISSGLGPAPDDAPPEPAAGAEDLLIDQDEAGLWDVLLEYIAQGSVVPVIGRDLLAVELRDAAGQPVPTLLYSAIARELARALRVSVPPEAFDGPNPLGAVASAFILLGGNPNQIYMKLPGIVKAIDARRVSGVPEALRQLVEIEPFKVFLTTTFDPLLSDCVERIRRILPKTMAYAPQAHSELSSCRLGDNRDQMLKALESLPAPVVVHLLGRYSSVPNYVVTEEDAFEFVYSLQETPPEGLFDLVAHMNLLIVGCRFPHWLVRFFLRTARRQRLLLSSPGRTDFLVDPTAPQDASLVQFLRDFKTQTEVFTRYGPVEFVGELSRRWQLRVRGDGGDPTADPITPSAIFISYASEDGEAAAQVADQIAARGLPVWRDRGRLGAGDDWERKIRRNIEAAGAFVPLLSRSSLKTGSREFRKEWRRALGVKAGLPQNDPFIYPIALDDVPRNSPEIDEELRALNWDVRGNGGTLSEGLLDRLRQAYRSAQMRGIPG